MAATPKEQSQPVDKSSMTKKQLSKVQACSINHVPKSRLQAKMRGAAFTTEDMQQLQYLQPVVNKCRKQMGLLQARAQEESSQQAATIKRRTDDQGLREKSAKHRTLETTHQGPTGDGRSKSSPENVGELFKKGVQEVPSSSPSSAARTPTPMPVVFEQAASDFQLEKNQNQAEQTHQNH